MHKFLLRLSLVLLVLSFVPWLLVPTLPWWPGSKTFKAAMVPVMLIGAEVIFWASVAIGGAEVLRRRRALAAVIKRRLGPRLRRRFWSARRRKKRPPKPQ